MKTPKLNPIILDAFDTIANRHYYIDSNYKIEKFNHISIFIQELTIIDDAFDAPLIKMLGWEPNQKLTLISLLAILSDKELKELFSIVPPFNRS